jgi:hypothetical protein
MPGTLRATHLLLAAFVGAGAVACVSILGDFDSGGNAGADASTPADAGPGDAVGAGDSNGDGGTGGDGALPPCSAPSKICGEQCVDIATSGANCGACGHGCGQGDAGCSQGLCQPMTVITDGPIVAFAIDTGKIFAQIEYDGGTGAIDECAVTGCAPLTHVIPTATDFSFLYDVGITASGGYLAVQSGEGNEPLEACSENGCGSFVNISGGADLNTWAVSGAYVAYSINGSRGDYIKVAQLTSGAATTLWTNGSVSGGGAAAGNPFALDGTDFAFASTATDGGTSLNTCSFASNCATPIVATTSVPDKVDVYDGVLYLTNVGGSGAAASVSTCPVAGCSSPTTFVTFQQNEQLVQTAVDSSGFYWRDAVGNISMCPLTGCSLAGISVTTSGSDPAASAFAVYDGFVYFVGTGANNDTVYAIAEPVVP